MFVRALGSGAAAPARDEMSPVYRGFDEAAANTRVGAA